MYIEEVKINQMEATWSNYDFINIKVRFGIINLGQLPDSVSKATFLRYKRSVKLSWGGGGVVSDTRDSFSPYKWGLRWSADAQS